MEVATTDALLLAGTNLLFTIAIFGMFLAGARAEQNCAAWEFGLPVWFTTSRTSMQRILRGGLSSACP